MNSSVTSLKIHMKMKVSKDPKVCTKQFRKLLESYEKVEKELKTLNYKQKLQEYSIFLNTIYIDTNTTYVKDLRVFSTFIKKHERAKQILNKAKQKLYAIQEFCKTQHRKQLMKTLPNEIARKII